MVVKTEQQIVEKIKSRYEHKTESKTKLEELKALDKKVKQPPIIFAYIFGIVGALVLGTGMCLAMEVIGSLVPLGIVVGVIGIAMVLATYPLFKEYLNKRKAKYADEILEKSNELLNKKGE